MKGYQPNLECKNQIEVFNRKNNFFLELGVKQETCNCENEECKCEECSK